MTRPDRTRAEVNTILDAAADHAAAKGARLIAEQRDAAVAELGDWRIPALELRTAAVRLDELSVAGVSGWLAPHPRHPRACAWFEAWETLREAISRFPA